MRPSNASKNDDLKLDVKPNVGIIQIPCSRPCVRGDAMLLAEETADITFLLTPLREGRLQFFTKSISGFIANR